MAKYVWSLTAHVLGVTCRPTNFDQFWEWAEQYIQNSKKFHMVGLAAICWALWRSMNNVFFENKKVRSDWGCLVCLACSFLDYWEGLQKNDDMVLLQAGAGVLKPAVLEFDAQVYSGAEERSNLLLTWFSWSLGGKTDVRGGCPHASLQLISVVSSWRVSHFSCQPERWQPWVLL